MEGTHNFKTVAVLLSLCSMVSCAVADNFSKVNLFRSSRTSVHLESQGGNGFNLTLTKDGVSELVGNIGRKTGNVVGVNLISDGENVTTIEFENNQTLTLSSKPVGNYLELHFIWEGSEVSRFEDCMALGEKHWFGGPQQKHQYWPIEKLELEEYSYISKEADSCAISEPYWLSSSGEFFYVDKTVPLFVDQNGLEKNMVCFIAEVKPPYSNKRTLNELKYVLFIADNAKTAHQYAVQNYLGKPVGYPDERMMAHPIWSTWARYKRDVNHSIVIEFANEILDHQFKNSQYEIDDLWEICYGSLTVDKNKFPDFAATNRQLKQMGFRVTVWIHPFINADCEPWYTEALTKGYLVANENGSVVTSWWNNNGTTAAYVDFTKAAARDWWIERLDNVQKEYEIDSFKFDAGETSWSPEVAVQDGDIREHPAHITMEYVKAVSKYGPMVEVRAGQRTQDLPIFVRMIDKDTYWTFENGLPTLVTTLLQMNLNGYPLVLPDMIGGNGYNEPPSKELFVRWLQANVFMPSLQYSYVPWDFDQETIELSLKFTDLHAQFTPAILEACKAAVRDGAPVNAPVWWIAPKDEVALGIWDEFLLGESILVAPVLEEGATSRDIYLPPGTWLAEGDSERSFEGGQWLRNYSAPLDTLPYFISAALTTTSTLWMVVLAAFLINLFAL